MPGALNGNILTRGFPSSDRSDFGFMLNEQGNSKRCKLQAIRMVFKKKCIIYRLSEVGRKSARIPIEKNYVIV